MATLGRMRVVVTGGSGFIGSHVVDRLLAAGHRPLIFDARRSSYHPAVDSVAADLADLDALCGALREADAVIHLAAAADVNEVVADPLDAERRNARGTAHVLEAARRCGVARVVYASTIWAYSDTPAERHHEALALFPPAHFYTATKLAGELYCHSYAELFGVEFTILRFGIPYGPRARPAAVIPALVARALAGEPLTISGDGSQSRRFVYVEDLADGVVRALAPVAANRTYNLVGHDDVTIREVAETIVEEIGDVELRYTPGRAADFAGAPVSGERAATELGWRPTTPFAEGVRRYIAWSRESTVPHAAEPSRRGALLALARRSALALAWAMLTAVMVIGLAVLLPVDQELDPYDTFFATLAVLMPIVLAGGFDWKEPAAGRLRAGLWVSAVACLGLAFAPVHIGHRHAWLFGLLALAAAGAVRLVGARPALPAWLGAEGG
jgi:UDP-glucose 4-epimerase